MWPGFAKAIRSEKKKENAHNRNIFTNFAMCRKCADSYEEFLLLCIKAFELDQFKNQVVTFVIFYEIAEIQGHV